MTHVTAARSGGLASGTTRIPRSTLMPAPSSDDKNSIYDTATSEIWQLAVYEPVHAGLEFTNIGGAGMLDTIARETALGAGQQVLELCSGTGAVARFLSARYGCAVTGVELNAAQLAHARAAAPAGARIRYLAGDVQQWQPDRPYDLVLLIDSLSLLGDLDAALRTASRALHRTGRLAFSDTVAGPRIRERTRGTAWDLDGLRPLPGPEGLTARLLDAGLTDVRLSDETDRAIWCFQRIADVLRDRRPAVAAVLSAEEYTQWRDSTDFYLTCFRTGQLTYWRGSARPQRPSTDPRSTP